MTLQLNQAERDLLLEVLKDRLGELREQIHHSTTSTFTDALKDTEQTLHSLIEKLEAAGSQ